MEMFQDKMLSSFYELLKHFSQIKRKKGTSSHNIAAHCRRTVLLGLISQMHFIIEREGKPQILLNGYK